MLAIFGVLLMITFLIPQAFDRFSAQAGASGAVIATVGDGEKIRGADFERARRELAVLSKTRSGILDLVKTPEHWLLLVREAERAGLVGADRAAFVPLGAGQVMRLTDDFIADLQTLTGERDPAVVRGTYAKLIGVSQLMSLLGSGGVYSDQRLKGEAERLLHQVQAQVIVLQADPDKVQFEPTEEQILQQMNAYADKLPGEGETGFGYKLPNRVKLEWLKISQDSVRNLVESSDAFSGVAQRVHWKRNPNKTFPAPPTGEGAAEAEVPQSVKDDLLAQLTRERMDDIVRDAVNQLRFNRRGLPEKDGYVELPPDWDQRKLGLQVLAESLRQKHGIDLPEYHSTGDAWTPISEVGTLEGIGPASTDKLGNVPIRLNQLVETAKEFNGQRGLVAIQKDVAGPPLRGTDGSMYLFRIIAADPTRTPSSVDEVRDKVITDLKRVEHFKVLEQQMSDLEKRAEADGMLPTALEQGTAIQSAGIWLADQYRIQQFARFMAPTVEPNPLPLIGQSPKTTEAIIDAARQIPLHAPIDTLSEADRTFAVAAKDKLAVLIVRLTRQTPLSQERFVELTQAGIIQDLIASEESTETDAIEQAFSFEALSKRQNLVPTREDAESEKESAQAAAGT
jgi:hypothetical protein